MISLKSLKWKNILSYGNNITTYTFTPGITRITGVNGNGKSVFIDALNYALFGKPFRKTTLPNLVNFTNKKELEVEIEFTSDDKTYRVHRGIKPNIFNIYINGELLNQDSHKRDYQAYLEENVYKFNESIFHQICLKSLTKYESFLTLSKGKKRQIIEELFEITVISAMSELNKSERKRLESEHFITTRDIAHQNELILQERENIERLKSIKKKIDEENESEKQKSLEEIGELRVKISNFNKGLDIIKNKEKEESDHEKAYKSLISDRDKLLSDMGTASAKVQVFEEKIAWLKQQCPTCLRVDEIEEGDDIKADKSEWDAIHDKYEEVVHKMENISELLNKCKTITDRRVLVEQKISSCLERSKHLAMKIKKSANTIEVNEDKFKSLKKKLLRLNTDISNINSERSYADVIYEILQDDGIKAYIIQKYLPLLNKLLNTYLQKFGLDLGLEFTHNFDVVINNNFKNHLTYENFSQGEKKRIDASVMFCFLEFCKLKYNTAKVNVLAFDEFTVGLDPEGEGTFYEILKDISDRDNMEIITVSHSSLIDPDKIDTVYSATMRSGFSNLEKVEEN